MPIAPSVGDVAGLLPLAKTVVALYRLPQEDHDGLPAPAYRPYGAESTNSSSDRFPVSRDYHYPCDTQFGSRDSAAQDFPRGRVTPAPSLR